MKLSILPVLAALAAASCAFAFDLPETVVLFR